MDRKGTHVNDPQRQAWMRQLWKLPWLLLIPIGFLLPRLAAQYPETVELYFSERIYPFISNKLGRFAALAPSSLAEMLVIALLCFALALVLLLIVRLLQFRFSLRRFLSFLLSLCIVAGVLLNVFYWVWGFNYARPSLYTLMDLKVEERPLSQLEALCYSLAEKAAVLRETLAEDEEGAFRLQADVQTYFDKLPAAYAKLGAEEPLFSQRVYPAKQVLFSEVMSYGGIAGIYIPFTAEANVNTHQPPMLLLSSAAHENAHFLGFAREDEANFIAYLACMRADDPAIVYSGVMLALVHCGNALYDADPDKGDALHATYTERMRRDLRDYNAYWDSYEGKAEEAVDKLNDQYLKHNQQEAGIKSYGMVVDLLLAYYFDQ